jgi:hypothetical protein
VKSAHLRKRPVLIAAGVSLVVTLLLVVPAYALEPPGWDLTPIAEPAEYPELTLDAGRAVFGPQERLAEGTISLYDLATSRLRTLTEGALGYGEGAQLDGDHLVFVRGTEQESDIYLLTISTGETLRLTDNEIGDNNPRIADDLVVWGADPPQNFRTPLWLYRISSGERLLLESDEGFVYPSDLFLSEEWVVWRRFERPDSTTWVYSGATGETRELAQLRADRSQVGLEALEDGVLYYVSRTPSGGYALHALDLGSGQDRAVWSSLQPFQSVRASEGRLAWASYDAGGSYVAILERGSGAPETRIYSPAYTVGGLVFSGDLLIWRGDARTTNYRVPTSYLFAYEISTGRLTRLTSPQLYTSRWETDGEHLLFSVNRWGAGRYPVFTAEPGELTAGGFSDVVGTDPYRTSVLGLQEAGVVGGYERPGGGAEYRPDARLNRAQFVKMLTEGFDFPVNEALVAPFTDLGPDKPDDLYPHEYVAAMVSMGIVKGTSPTRFSPWAPVTRAQLVTLAVRAVQELRQPSLLSPGEGWMTYTLGDFDPTHAPSMSLAERNGLLDGVVGFGKSWNPWAPATRGEAAQVLWNAMTLRE